MNLRNIYIGWARAIGVKEIPDEVREIAKERIETCLKCEHAKEQWLTKIVEGALVKDVEHSGIGCDICKCPINEAALSDKKKCPLGKWKR